jgi:hypothetical protein
MDDSPHILPGNRSISSEAFLEMVRKDLEDLLRNKNEAERIELLRGLAKERSDWESAPSLDEKIKRARSFLAREMLGIAGGGELAARLAAIEEKLDRVLALLEQIQTGTPSPGTEFRATSLKAAELKSNAPAGAEKAVPHEEGELFRGEEPERGDGELSARAARVLRFLEEQGGASFKEVQNALSLSREEVLEAVSELFDKGKIRKEGVKYVPR